MALRHGHGAISSCKLRYLHPSKLVSNHYLNADQNMVVSGLMEQRKEIKKVNGVDRACIVMRHEHFPNQLLYACVRWVRVVREGTAPFELLAEPEHSTRDRLPPENSDQASLRYISEGFSVDNDSDPAPENEPLTDGEASINPNVPQYGEWGWNGVDQHRQDGNIRRAPDIIHDATRPIDHNNLLFSLFLLMIPWQFICKVIIVETNRKLETPLTKGEFLVFIGLWLLMSTTEGNHQHEFWSSQPVDKFEGAPYRLGEYMSCRRFNNILSSLTLTSKNPPTFLDPFWKVRDLLAAFNANMMSIFQVGWISCLNKSMSVWLSRWTCPGWMFVPGKSHPFGNEYHTSACGQWGVLFFMELVEGTSRPAALGPQRFDDLGKTVGLVLRMCQPLFATGKAVVMGSGFCVLRVLIELRNRGIYASIMIEKRKYWPQGIDGDAIQAHMQDKDVGTVDALPGTLDKRRYHLFVMKDVDHTMILMSTFGALQVVENKKAATSRLVPDGAGGTSKVSFNYTEPFQHYFENRGAIDNHNAKRHSPISLEETWTTKTWEHRVFAFVLAVCEINAYLIAVHKFSFRPDVVVLKMRKQLAKALIHNSLNAGVAVGRSKREEGNQKEPDYNVCHETVTAPKFAKKWDGQRWDLSSKIPYPQHRCRHPDCSKMIRTFCSCRAGYWRCEKHIGYHHAMIEMTGAAD